VLIKTPRRRSPPTPVLVRPPPPRPGRSRWSRLTRRCRHHGRCMPCRPAPRVNSPSTATAPGPGLATPQSTAAPVRSKPSSVPSRNAPSCWWRPTIGPVPCRPALLPPQSTQPGQQRQWPPLVPRSDRLPARVPSTTWGTPPPRRRLPGRSSSTPTLLSNHPARCPGHQRRPHRAQHRRARHRRAEPRSCIRPASSSSPTPACTGRRLAARSRGRPAATSSSPSLRSMRTGEKPGSRSTTPTPPRR
jgi:hypothetical protein